MRWQSKIGLGILIQIICTLLSTCTPTYTLKVTLDHRIDLPLGKSVQVFLISAANQTTIDQIRTSSFQYFSRSVSRLQDSVRALYRDYILAAAEKGRFENKYQSTFAQYKLDYLTKVKAECFRVQKIANFWQFFVKIYNNGSEQIDGLVLTVQYSNEVLINRQEYAIKLAPNSNLVLSSIYLDLTGNMPLQYRLSSLPGGLEKLPTAITIKVESIKSEYSHFKEVYQQEIARLTEREVTIALMMEEYINTRFARELTKVSMPLNQILLNNIRQQASQVGTLVPRDTLRFSNIKAGEFHLLACTSPDDSLQWLQAISIPNNSELLLSPYNLSQYFFRVTPELLEKYTDLTPQEPTFLP